MAQRRIVAPSLDFAAIRAELAVPGDFDSVANAEAERSAARPLPTDRFDATDIEFVTVDPAGSKDLDQALHIADTTDGYLVSYAIADVAHFVEPGGALDEATHHRGETFYFPDTRIPLHPSVLSEGAASLLPGQDRPAVLWQIGLDVQGNQRSATVRRAVVRSRRQFSYPELAAALAGGSAPAGARNLLAVGRLRQTLSRRRHAITLNLPEQQVVSTDAGWSLELRAPLDIENANAEISLLTGIAAATIMLEGKVGVLRTLPPPSDATVAELRRIAPALGVSWPDDVPPGDVIATLDPTNAKHAAFLEQASSLLRGAGYRVFDGELPDETGHAGIGGPYAHVTAPLRRLIDRYATEICLSLQADQPVPDWVHKALPELPEQMQAADHLAHTVDRAVVDAVEALLLTDRVGEHFPAVVLESSERGGTIAIEEPPVRAKCGGDGLRAGSTIQVRLDEADVATRLVRFSAVAGAGT
ncbi:RNB domain-containing ribonuclease [Jatrophihabitans telluris]|uniref:RNB domain-containing ribonuclease n=1 Tax=Jatrophihabitans telluris TaxID=2038343 RepID=A0ABY4QWD5_9ACTN|nr:RNB domain-containing ribonuclease [Jatrophihabitans telluris]UQX87294.1 RNB domain-containing ribonuclease [Jatrophihabitans telluris]